jgi:hypothetical protein
MKLAIDRALEAVGRLSDQLGEGGGGMSDQELVQVAQGFVRAVATAGTRLACIITPIKL